MPLYEYECDACGHRFEVIQKFSDAPIEKCPKCGSSVHKLMSSPAFQFKGSGWYVTDYARKDKDTKDRHSDSAGSKPDKDAKSDTSAKDAKETKESKTEKASADSSSSTTSTSSSKESSKT